MKQGLLIDTITPHTQLQDLGRFGYQAYGVTRSGAMDRYSLRIANILLGNPENTACLEFNLIGGKFTVTCKSMRVSFAGGDFPISVNGQAIESYRSFRLVCGDQLEIGMAKNAIRGYLAIAGGLQASTTLGSYSTHLRFGLGGFNGSSLKPGETLPTTNKFALIDQEVAVCERDRIPLSQRIRVVLGPQDSDFPPESIQSFINSPFTVKNESDRMGFRLSGNTLAHSSDGNIISDPTIPGSIQVPPDGNPIVLMADCGTTGGYPKIATTISTDLGVLSQHPPGSLIHFEAISVTESQSLFKEREDYIKRLPRLLAPVDTVPCYA